MEPSDLGTISTDYPSRLTLTTKKRPRGSSIVVVLACLPVQGTTAVRHPDATLTESLPCGYTNGCVPPTLEILAVLLSNGTCLRTGAQLLRRETVDTMFTNQIPQFPNFGRRPIPAVKPDLAREIDEFYAVAGDPPQGWGLTFMLSNGGATGRSQGTGHWAGIANNWWWCDREKGVAGMVATQILPFGDDKVHDLWEQVETEVYRGLLGQGGQLR